jgi:hypothetical protein
MLLELMIIEFRHYTTCTTTQVLGTPLQAFLKSERSLADK